MENKFEDVLSKAKPMSDDKAKAAKEIVAKLRAMLGDGFAEKMKGLKKVTVASDSEEGLKKGLEIAKDKVEEVEDESAKHEAAESPAKEMKEEEAEAPADEEAQIAELEKRLEELKAKKSSKSPSSEIEEAKKSLKSYF